VVLAHCNGFVLPVRMSISAQIPPSVGSLVKKLQDINPDLGTPELIHIIRSVTRTQGGHAHDFVKAQVVDENLAIEMARSTLKNNLRKNS
jgi:hypothetical protein